MSMKKSNIGGKNVYHAFDAASYATNGITRQDVLQLKDAFDLLDPNGTGKIEPSQLANLIKAYNADGKNRSLQLAVEEITASKKPVDFPNFLTAFTAFLYGGTKPNYSKIFKLFDDEKVGCFNEKNIRRVFKELDLKITEDEVQLMVERTDLNNDGVITEDEFAQVMAHISPKI